ncbi:MAG: hypothetical protein KC713_08680 [Candidatus Omnitrophica bacterium]|nr:hypothetical protein [Candidatus Omnitrophota bacterium]
MNKQSNPLSLFNLLKHRITNHHGQNFMEYAVLLMTVMAGIIIMGPYVTRSWNAQLKGWEDSVVDSMTDPLLEGNRVSISGCNCEDTRLLECGNPDGSTFCEVRKRHRTSKCEPPSICEQQGIPDEECVWDSACCDPLTPQLPENIDDLIKEHCLSANNGGDFSQCPCGIHAGCPNGHALSEPYVCGRDNTELTECLEYDLCSFECQVTTVPPVYYAGWCPDDNIGLPEDNIQNSAVWNSIHTNAEPTCSLPEEPPKCEWECLPEAYPMGFLNGFYTTCGQCKPGQLYQGVCPGSSCQAGITALGCGPTECVYQARRCVLDSKGTTVNHNTCLSEDGNSPAFCNDGRVIDNCGQCCSSGICSSPGKC